MAKEIKAMARSNVRHCITDLSNGFHCHQVMRAVTAAAPHTDMDFAAEKRLHQTANAAKHEPLDLLGATPADFSAMHYYAMLARSSTTRGEPSRRVATRTPSDADLSSPAGARNLCNISGLGECTAAYLHADDHDDLLGRLEAKLDAICLRVQDLPVWPADLSSALSRIEAKLGQIALKDAIEPMEAIPTQAESSPLVPP